MNGESEIIRLAEAIASDRVQVTMRLFKARPFLNWLALQNAFARSGIRDDEKPSFLRDLASRISQEGESADPNTTITFGADYVEIERLDSLIHAPGSLASPSEFIGPIYKAYVRSGGSRNHDLERKRRISIE